MIYRWLVVVIPFLLCAAPPQQGWQSARKCLDQCSPFGWGGSASATFLMWQPREDELTVAVKGGEGKRLGVEFEWSPGFKVDLDLQFPDRAWDLNARWTAFYNCSSGDYSGSLIPIWVLPTLGSVNYGHAKGVWRAHLNVVDLELGYDPMLTKNLGFRLHCGIKGVALLQHYLVRYSQGLLNGSQINSSRCELRNRCYAIGPRIGFNSMWRLSSGWSVLGDFAGALPIDSAYVKRTDVDQGQTVINGTFRESFYAFHPVLEGLLGIGWDGCFGAKKGVSLSVQAAYEIQTFWERNQFRQMVMQEISFQEFAFRTDFTVQGVNLKVSIGF